MRIHLASSLLLVVGCTGTLEDEGGGTEPPPSTDVQVTVRDGMTPQPNVRVVFQAADDTLVAEAVTGPDGTAIAEMPDGGSVTVIRHYISPPPPEEQRPDEIYTYVGVAAGDRLVLGNPTSEGPASAINVIVPEAANGNIRITTPCGSGEGAGPTIPITMRGCFGDVAFYVRDGDGQSFVKRAPYSENVDLSLEGLNQSLSSTLSASNIPPNAAVSIDKRIQADSYTLFSTGPQRVEGGATTVDLPQLTGVDDLTVTMVQVDNRTQLIATRSPYSPGSSVVDASAGLIANITDTPLVTPLAISWTEEGTGTADAVTARLTITRGDVRFLRSIIGPHDGLSLRIPQLAAVDAVYNISTLDQVDTAIGIAKVTGGYGAVRARAFAVESLVDATPMSGLVTLSYTGNEP